MILDFDSTYIEIIRGDTISLKLNLNSGTRECPVYSGMPANSRLEIYILPPNEPIDSAVIVKTLTSDDVGVGNIPTLNLSADESSALELGKYYLTIKLLQEEVIEPDEPDVPEPGPDPEPDPEPDPTPDPEPDPEPGPKPETEIVWALVDYVSLLSSGDKIVIVASTSDMAMSNVQATNNRPAVEVAKSKDIVEITDDTQIITVEDGTLPGTLSFFVDGDKTGYLYAASSSSNYLKTESDKSDNSSWKIEINEYSIASVVAQGTNTKNIMRYNPTSKLFSCYSSGQQDIKIYKLVERVLAPYPYSIRNTVDEVPVVTTTIVNNKQVFVTGIPSVGGVY